MPSTPAVGTPISVASSVSPNTPSPSSVPPSYISSSSPGVNTVSLLTSVTISPTASVTTSVLSKQSQQPSPASQTTMTATTLINTVAPTSASPSAPEPSTISPATSRVSSEMSSSVQSATTVASSSDNQSTVSTSETSVQPTTLLTTKASTTTQSSTLASSSLSSHLPSTTASSTPTSAAPSTSNAPVAITSSASHSGFPSQSSFPARTDFPLTTVLESTTIFITSTNSQGQVVTSVPPVVTEVITTTGSGGIVTTVTQAVVNPTLASNNITTGGSSFFADTGAVVGVFVVVGLASASIMMWILFAIRRRQRMKRIEQDTAVEAAVAAAGLNRAPLDGDAEDVSPISPNTYHQFSSEMSQRSTLFGLRGSDSLPTSARLSEVLDDSARDNVNSHPGCPVEHRAGSHPEGYVPARTTSPSLRAERCTEDLGSSRDRKSSYGHTPTYSAGSFEPLLANYVQNVSDQDPSALAIQPSRNRPSRRLGSGLAPNGYSPDDSPENGSRRTSLRRQSSSDSSVLRDEEDYTRYVLTVRNVPDNQSQHSS